MVDLLQVLVIIISLIVVVIAAHVIILPVKFSGRLSSSRKNLFLAKVRWGVLRSSVKIAYDGTGEFYLYSFRLKKFSVFEKDEPSPGDGEDKESKEKFDTGKIFPVLDQVVIILRQIGFDYLKVNAKIGLGDPYDTGIVYGYASALRGALSGLKRIDINVLPVFDTEMFEIDVEAGFIMRRCYRVIAPVIRMGRLTRKNDRKKEPAAGKRSSPV